MSRKQPIAMTQKQFDEFKNEMLTGNELYEKLLNNSATKYLISERAKIMGVDEYGNDLTKSTCSFAGYVYLKYKDSLGNGEFKYISEKAAYAQSKELRSMFDNKFKTFDYMRIFDIIEIYLNNYNILV